LEEVEARDGGELNTRQVSECLGERGLLVVDYERTTALSVASVSHLSLSASELLAILYLLDIDESTDRLQESDSLRGLGDTINGLVVNNERNFSDLLDLVTASEDEGRDGGSSESGDESVASLVHADLAVPSSPGLGGSEHTTTTAHIAESTLTGSAGTTARNTGNTRHSATSTPRFGGGLVASVLGNSVRLSLVLGHSGVNIVDDISTDGSS